MAKRNLKIVNCIFVTGLKFISISISLKAMECEQDVANFVCPCLPVNYFAFCSGTSYDFCEENQELLNKKPYANISKNHNTFEQLSLNLRFNSVISWDLYEEHQDFFIKNENFHTYNYKNIFEQLPLEVYQTIISKLNHLNAIYLSLTSKEFNKRYAKFCENYIKIKSLKKWDSSISAIKVIYANQCLEEGDIERAAKLGLPKARSLLNNKRNKMKNNINNDYNFISENRFIRRWRF